MSSLVSVMSHSYLHQFLHQLEFLSHCPCTHVVTIFQFLIHHVNCWNSVRDDASPADRICIEGVTSETISCLVENALNDIATLERFPLERWATPFYNAVALGSQGELVVDIEQGSRQNFATTAASTIVISLENNFADDDSL